MNVLFVSELSNLGGGETSLLNLIIEFNNNFNEMNPVLLCLKEGKLTEESRAAGIKTIIYDYKNDIKKVKIINCIRKIRAIIKLNKINVIQTNEWKTSFILSLINKSCFLKCKVIWVCHGQWYQFNFIKKNMVNLFIDKIISVSNVVKENLISNGINPKKIVRIPLGIDINKFNNCDAKKIRQELQMENNEKVFATIGRFQEIKGQKLVIEAAKELKELGKKFKILFVGDSIFDSEKDNKYKKECLNMIKEYKLEEFFFFLGVRRDIGNILSGIDALIIPSINESFGMVVIEAFAAGCLVISTPCDGPSEVIQNGVLGFVLSERTTECLKDKMEDILEDKIKLKEISKNQKEYSKNYSVNKICSMYANIYN
ncbi:glycosyltransferase family 1 protein [Clostridium chromiireducens]|uniref:Glycosyltransferase family 1 protein n=1 Tax=Clostridium chromiireducens TaxID=225345 RepID=A0A399IPR5_9CLOT|nr:glycosyltransferase family 4 protein [Clostridium chromiireducens]RII35015.1 glycosyltransferase family 1 protein [Clostridium chromiireducens]